MATAYVPRIGKRVGNLRDRERENTMYRKLDEDNLVVNKRLTVTATSSRRK